ncbi:DUF2797 domain-containing protein [Shewanella sp. JM162201]|uniref:DUF2797 domain-containing protein n=1 Tax=Shewanella jiangmenensis TaxID=2837387 RepID=A0ABS5V5V1_9GAMM|nr:DUF2797 domain-containing protein [Shewanella jiangmenensis]MBT1444991.1 DUF2797 domain-containing protein [Shewanella jiangmenensis]
MQGTLKKMRTALDEQGCASYSLRVGEGDIALNPLIGKPLKLIYSGNIYCCNCGKKTKKSYSEGHCFVCMQKLASCDMCILKPETCHYDAGTCREPEWAQSHCFVPHFVYLSNTSGLKVGITRHSQIPTRWIDQGATQGLPILKVASRKISGLIEVEIAKLVADKTHWQAMLKGDNAPMALEEEAARLIEAVMPVIGKLKAEFGEDAVQVLSSSTQPIAFPVSEYPLKVKSFNLDKEPLIDAVLLGIKGQYLIFDTGVINIRKYTGYEVSVEC